MTLRSSELQSDGDLDSIRNSCDVCNNDILKLQSFLGYIEICIDPRIVFPRALTWIKRQLCLLQEALLLLWQQAVVEVRNKLLIDSLDYHY